MSSIKFSEHILIHGSAHEVFDYTQDYDNRLAWDTFLQKATIIDGAKKADLGVRTYCEAKNGIGIETEYVSFRRPKVTAVKMTKGPFMFKSFLGSWTFNAKDTQLTEVVFLYSFQLRFPFSLLSKWITSRLRKDVRQRLTDLKENIEQLELKKK